MIEVIERAVDSAYNDYIFIGREKVVDKESGKVTSNPIIDFGISVDEDKVTEMIADLAMVDDEMMFKILRWGLKAFEMSDIDKYERFRKEIKRVKRKRLENIQHRRLILN